MQNKNDDVSGITDEAVVGARGPLYKLFMEKCPPFLKTNNGQEYLDVEALAEAMDVSRQSVYQWFWNDKLTAARVMQLLKLKGCNFAREDLLEFLLKA